MAHVKCQNQLFPSKYFLQNSIYIHSHYDFIHSHHATLCEYVSSIF